MSPFLLSLLSLTNIIKFIVFFLNYNFNNKTKFVCVDLDFKSFITNFSRTNYLSIVNWKNNQQAIIFNSAIIIYIGLFALAYVTILLNKIFIITTGDKLIFDNNNNNDYPITNIDSNIKNNNKDLNYFKNSLSNNNSSLFDYWLLIKYIKKKIN
jgi:hypothetical protein